MNAEATETARAASKKHKREVEKVSMEDGREVEFVGKQRMLKEAQFDDDGNWIGNRFDFRDGRVLSYLAPSSDFKLTNGHYAIGELAGHGGNQKFGDAAAGEQTVGDMYEAVRATIEQVTGGDWSAEREGDGFSGTSVLLRALVRLSERQGKAKTIDQVRAFLKGKDKKAKDSMRASDRLRPIVQEIEAEDIAKAGHVDTAALFDELDNAEAA